MENGGEKEQPRSRRKRPLRYWTTQQVTQEDADAFREAVHRVVKQMSPSRKAEFIQVLRDAGELQEIPHPPKAGTRALDHHTQASFTIKRVGEYDSGHGWYEVWDGRGRRHAVDLESSPGIESRWTCRIEHTTRSRKGTP